MIIPAALGLLIGILSSGSGLGGGFLVVPFLLQMGKEAKVAVMVLLLMKVMIVMVIALLKLTVKVFVAVLLQKMIVVFAMAMVHHVLRVYL